MGRRAGRFRADLFHRLSVFTVAVPPVRETGSDRLLLLDHFRQIFATQARVPPFQWLPAAEVLWMEYSFPGNVRELRNIVIRLTARYAGQSVTPDQLLAEFDSADLPDNNAFTPKAVANDLEQARKAALDHLRSAGKLNLDTTLEFWERGYIEAAIELSAGNMSQAARRLGINRSTLYNRMEGWSRR